MLSDCGLRFRQSSNNLLQLSYLQTPQLSDSLVTDLLRLSYFSGSLVLADAVLA